MKRIVALIMVLAMSLGLVGCVPKKPSVGDGDDVIININVSDLGYGTQWLYDSVDRFEEKQKDVEYPGGKVGVAVKINPGELDTVSSFNSSANHIVFGGGLVRNEATSGNLLNLTADQDGEYGINIFRDIYTNEHKTGVDSVYDLIREENRSTYQANDGNFYALPTYQVFPGLSYDKHLFDTEGLYFAKPGAANTELFESELLGIEYHFVDPSEDGWEQLLSVGPDGKEETSDDGLPSSLFEFIALCEYMKEEKSIAPLQLCGSALNLGYSDQFLHGLVYSLMGEGRAKATRTFSGEIEAVVGFLDGGSNASAGTLLAPGLDGIFMPKTKIVNITEETGFYTQWSVERYYAMALMQIMVDNDFLAPGSRINNGINHLEAEKRFVFSGYKNTQGVNSRKIAMLNESSYWYNESSKEGYFEDFYKYNKSVDDRDVRWMSLPVNIANSVTGEDVQKTVNGITENVKGKTNVMPISKINQVVFNKKAIEKDSTGAVLKAVSDFVDHFYSEEECIQLTLSQGMSRDLNFDMPSSNPSDPDYDARMEDYNCFYSSLAELLKTSTVIPMSASNNTFYACLNDGSFKMGEGGGYLNPSSSAGHFGYAYIMGNAVATSAKLGFTTMVQSWTPSAWRDAYYQGSNNAGVDYATVNGEKVMFSTNDSMEG